MCANGGDSPVETDECRTVVWWNLIRNSLAVSDCRLLTINDHTGRLVNESGCKRHPGHLSTDCGFDYNRGRRDLRGCCVSYQSPCSDVHFDNQPEKSNDYFTAPSTWMKRDFGYRRRAVPVSTLSSSYFKWTRCRWENGDTSHYWMIINRDTNSQPDHK